MLIYKWFRILEME